MSLKIPTLPAPHMIALSGLVLLFILSLISRPFIPTLAYAASMLAVAVAIHAVWKKGLKWDIFFRDTLVSILIIILLLEPATSLSETVPVLLTVAASLGLRAFVRYKGLPIFNPASSAIMAVLLVSYTGFFSTPLASWWGTNYILAIGTMSLPVGSIISFVLAILLITRLKKWWYALVFFALFTIGLALLGGIESVTGTLLDGTIYFFFAMMACEPKTAPITKNHQLIAGIVLALALTAGIAWSFPSEHIMAILIANLATFALKNAPFLRNWFA